MIQEYVVVASAISSRPWQVLGLLAHTYFVHGSYKTRAAAVARAKELGGQSRVKVISDLPTVHREIYDRHTLQKE